MFSKKHNNIISPFKLFMTIFAAVIFSFQSFHSAFAINSIETKLMYYPIDKKMSDVRLELKEKLQDTYFYSLDGVKLNGWYIKAEKNKPTVIYCHGQGENISLWQSVAQTLADNGYGVFMLDYRGHGKSEGKPSETGLYTDLESSVKYLKEIEKIPQSNIVLWGRSIGGAVVTDVASRDNFKGVILESTFTNIRDEAIYLCDNNVLEGPGGFFGGLAEKFVRVMPFTQKFENDKKVFKIKAPLLIGASVNDRTVPVEMSKKLASLCPKAKLFISQKGSHHESEWFKDEAIQFLNSL